MCCLITLPLWRSLGASRLDATTLDAVDAQLWKATAAVGVSRGVAGIHGP